MSVLDSAIDWSFNHDADLAARTLRLLYDGSGGLGWGVPQVSAATVVLQHRDLAPLTLADATLQDARTVLAPLPADLPAGYYDVTLTIKNTVTGLTQTVSRAGLPFGRVDVAVLALEPPSLTSKVFGEEVALRLVEPVGRTLTQLGLTPDRLQPKLGLAGGHVVSAASLVQVADRVMRFRLPARYEGYSLDRSMHVLDPGFTSLVPLQLDVSKLPVFGLRPLQLTQAQITSVLDRLVTATPVKPQLPPGERAVWRLVGTPKEALQPPAGMSAVVFEAVKDLLFRSGASVTLDCSLQYQAQDALGLPGTSVTTSRSGPLNPNSLVHSADFGLLRPRFLRHGPAAPTAADGATATLTVAGTATFNDAAVFSGSVPIRLTSSLVQLPLAIPSVAVLTDGRYETDFARPHGDVLVVTSGMGHTRLSTKASPVPTTAALGTIVGALRLVDRVLPVLRSAFPALPFGQSVVKAGPEGKTAIGIVADWLQQTPNVVVLGADAEPHLGSLGTHPGYEDKASAVVLVGMPQGQRTLRLFADRTTDPTRSAYLDLRVPSGHLVASLWTLHESVFQDGLTARTPFRAITEPLPKGQRDQAERDATRPNMPWWPITGHSFGNVTSAYRWI